MNAALNVLCNISALNRHNGEPREILRMIDNEKQETKEELATSILSIIQEGKTQILINFLTLGIELRGAINHTNELIFGRDDRQIDMLEDVANDSRNASAFKALVDEGCCYYLEALEIITDGDVCWIPDDYCDPYESIGHYYGELLFESCSKYERDTFERYFDYEAYGRDISYEIEWYQTDDGIFEVCR